MDEKVTWEEAIDAFIDHKRVTTKPTTVRFYKSRLGRLLVHVNARRPFVQLDRWSKRYMDAYGVQRLQSVSKATWRHDVVAVREFLSYVAEEFKPELGWTHSPLDRYELPDAPQPHIQMPTDTELRQLIKAISDRQDPKNPKMASRSQKETRRVKLRDLAIVRMLITTGARVGEIIGMRMSDFDARSLEVTFRETKSNRPRTVCIEKLAAKAVDDWLIEREKLSRLRDRHGNQLVENDYLFISTTGGPMQLRATERRLELYLEYAGITGWTLHGLRHWAATTIIDRTDLETAQQVLGHRNAATTQRYDHRAKKRAQERHKGAALLETLEGEDKRHISRPGVFNR